MIAIDIYHMYKITIRNEYSRYTEDSTPNDVDFITETDKKEYICEGGALLNTIAMWLNDEDISEIKWGDDVIWIDFFNPRTGCSSELYVEVKVNEG